MCTLREDNKHIIHYTYLQKSHVVVVFLQLGHLINLLLSKSGILHMHYTQASSTGLSQLAVKQTYWLPCWQASYLTSCIQRRVQYCLKLNRYCYKLLRYHIVDIFHHAMPHKHTLIRSACSVHVPRCWVNVHASKIFVLCCQWNKVTSLPAWQGQIK